MSIQLFYRFLCVLQSACADSTFLLGEADCRARKTLESNVKDKLYTRLAIKGLGAMIFISHPMSLRASV